MDIPADDFTARSSDELSLARGDKAELVERDDDFGDGWYLGRHLTTGATGLFPEVYTKIAPNQGGQAALPQYGGAGFQRSTPVVQQQPSPQILAQQNEQRELEQKQQQQQAQKLSPPSDASPSSRAQLPKETQPEAESVQPDNNRASVQTLPDKNRVSVLTVPAQQEYDHADHELNTGEVVASQALSSPSEPAPLQMAQTQPAATTRPMSSNRITVATSTPPGSAIPKNVLASAQHGPGAESPVMNEALAVIQEHISDMSTPRISKQADRKPSITNDSASDYSSHLTHDDRRMSYINGSETDEEEEQERMLQRAEVNKWTADQVGGYLASVGVDPKHCDVFRDQEISGDVLLGMDQPTVFLKEFELGSVGKRLKTWQRIKALQDEVTNGPEPMSNNRRQTSNYSEFTMSDRGHSGMGPPRSSSGAERPGSRHTASNRYSQRQRTIDSIDSQSTAYMPDHQQNRPSTGAHRPSAASIRELNHSRRHSSIDSPSLINTPASTAPSVMGPPASTTAHKKLPSFDRNWTMGAGGSQSEQPSGRTSMATRPVSQAGSQPTPVETQDDLLSGVRSTPYEFDRGYFSGTEADRTPGSKNVLKKIVGSHSRNSSYADEARQRSATTVGAGNRHSHFGSMDSIQQSHISPAGAKYYGLGGSRRSPSSASRPMPPPKELSDGTNGRASPMVTKLDGRDKERSPVLAGQEWLQPSIQARQAAHAGGFRAISDAVTGTEKQLLNTKLQQTHDIEVATPSNSNRSPSQGTADSTPSGGHSLDLGDAGSKSSMGSARGPKATRKKSKKETSAYTRGLLKISPKDAMKDCDYSGWMKKKSNNLMTTWKPRLFILKGKRLSYYYSENDTEEKGLIDISFHRVLPADNDRLTGLHAQLTGALGTSSTPHGSATPTAAQQDAKAAALKDGTLGTAGLKPSDNQMFIFKLVPPRAGLSRGVTFTKPTVHYFAVENVTVARLWMAALMKATIEREGDGKVTTTYQQKTVSLRKAREMRQRPPALMGLDEEEGGGDRGQRLGLGLKLGGQSDGADADTEEDVDRSGIGANDKRGSYRGVDPSPVS